MWTQRTTHEDATFPMSTPNGEQMRQRPLAGYRSTALGPTFIWLGRVNPRQILWMSSQTVTRLGHESSSRAGRRVFPVFTNAPVNSRFSDDSEERVWRESDRWSSFLLAGIFYAARRSHLSPFHPNVQALRSAFPCSSPRTLLSISGPTSLLERVDLGLSQRAELKNRINCKNAEYL